MNYDGSYASTGTAVWSQTLPFQQYKYAEGGREGRRRGIRKGLGKWSTLSCSAGISLACVERQAYISICEAASKQCATGPHVAHCTRTTLLSPGHNAIITQGSILALATPKGRPFGQILPPPFSHFNFHAFCDHIEEGSGTRLALHWMMTQVFKCLFGKNCVIESSTIFLVTTTRLH